MNREAVDDLDVVRGARQRHRHLNVERRRAERQAEWRVRIERVAPGLPFAVPVRLANLRGRRNRECRLTACHLILLQEGNGRTRGRLGATPAATAAPSEPAATCRRRQGARRVTLEAVELDLRDVDVPGSVIRDDDRHLCLLPWYDDAVV